MKVPPALLHSLQNVEGFDKKAFEVAHHEGEQITSIRFNNRKLDRVSKKDVVEEVLEVPGITSVPWSSSGYYLSARPSFTADPLFHGGAYYVQEASSMFLEEVLKQSIDSGTAIKVLDLCAAPGGKSTLVQSFISETSLLVSNEVIKTRVPVLMENIAKWGAPNVIVTNNDPKDFQRLPGYFDVIIVDAPCSGSGLFRKDPAALNEWSEQQVELCSHRQQRILSDVLPSLKEEGILIYSTCSFSAEENENINDWLLENHPLRSLRNNLDPAWNIVETISPKTDSYGYRFYPDKLKGEGFFISSFMKKPLNNLNVSLTKTKRRFESLSSREIDVVAPWLHHPGKFFFIKQGGEVIAIPVCLEDSLAGIQSALYIKKAGIKLGTIIRNELIPAHELALSTIINPDVPALDVDKATALQYLRKQDLQLNSGVKGWTMLTYLQLPLGWIKGLSNRINNYYPKEWRIINK